VAVPLPHHRRAFSGRDATDAQHAAQVQEENAALLRASRERKTGWGSEF